MYGVICMGWLNIDVRSLLYFRHLRFINGGEHGLHACVHVCKCQGVCVCVVQGEVCVMGERQVYMKRKPGTRCSLGREYSRVVSAEPCICSLYDFEWWVTHVHARTHVETQSGSFSNRGNEWQKLRRIKGLSVACREQKLQGSNQLYILIKCLLNVETTVPPHISFAKRFISALRDFVQSIT